MKASRMMTGLALVLAMAACNEAAAPGESFEALFELEAVGGAPLPFVTGESVIRRNEVAGGAIQLRADGTYAETLTLQSVYPSGVVDRRDVVEQGTYTVRGRVLEFTQSGSGAEPWRATLDGDALSYTLEGNVYLYRQQIVP